MASNSTSAVTPKNKNTMAAAIAVGAAAAAAAGKATASGSNASTKGIAGAAAAGLAGASVGIVAGGGKIGDLKKPNGTSSALGAAESSGSGAIDITSELKNDTESFDGMFKSINAARNDRGLLDTYTMRLFGSPFQMLDSVDKRFPSLNTQIGNEYLRNFMLNSPILHIKPGMPIYTGGNNSLVRDIAQEALLGNSGGDPSTVIGSNAWNNLLVMLAGSTIFSSGKKLERRLFGFRQTYWRYISSVNYMCRTCAIYLGLESLPVFTGTGTMYTLALGPNPINWGKYRFRTSENFRTPNEEFGDLFTGEGAAQQITGEIRNAMSAEEAAEYNYLHGNSADEESNQSLSAALGDAAKATKEAFQNLFSGISNIQERLNDYLERPVDVKFMCEPSSFTESFTNQTSESMIEQAINSLDEGIGSEIAFITGSKADVGVLGGTMQFLGDTLSGAATQLSSLVEPVTGGFVSNLISGGLRSLKGQKMVYPNIYKKTDVKMDYSFTIKLRSPYGDRYNYYMNILVPLFHLICLAVPRLVTSNATTSPFLCQAYIPGICTVNLGIVENLTINKNPEGNHVSVDGYPLSVDVTLNVQDLYQALAISPADDPASFLYNTTLTDYLANCAGLDPSIATHREMKAAQIVAIKDFFTLENWMAGLATEPILGNLDDWFMQNQK